MATYTDQQKTEAVQAYVEYGADHAAELIGCNRATIFRWVGQFATVATQKREEVKEAVSVRWEAKREALRDAMLDAALAGAAMAIELASDPENAKAYQALSIGAGTFLDKVRLEMGEHTDRTQVVTLGLVERSIEQLESELGKRAPANT